MNSIHPKNNPRSDKQPGHHPHPDNKRVILLLALVVALITLLIIGAAVLILFQLFPISFNPQPMMDNHMMMDERRVWPFGGFLVILVILFFLGRWSRNRLSHPLEKVLDAADSISKGDLTTRIEGIHRGPFQPVQQAINRMTEELQRNDELRRNQTADIAHELNTPIHIIRGYLEGISDQIYRPDEEMIELLLEETSLLSRLVEDLRLLSLADAGKLPTHPELINLGEILEDVRVSFQGQADQQSISFLVNLAPNCMISADLSHLYRIINNLTSNALANTPAEGSITLEVQPQGENVVLTITDTGCGIEAQDLDHIFDRFWRKDKSRQRKDGGGYGLGLSIVQHLTLSNQGRIDVVSTPDVGTTFTLTFPKSQSIGS